MERKKLVFATNNQHKLREIREIAGDKIEILSLADIGCAEDIPEKAPTIAGNAVMKAEYVSGRYGVDCFADDTGLEVDALGGAPGVHTARYASAEGHDTLKNMELLLQNLQGQKNRKAQFVTVIALVENGSVKIFEGICPGEITTEQEGTNGFGYDPVFRPLKSSKTFACMTDAEKNKVSHRGKATRALIDYLMK